MNLNPTYYGQCEAKTKAGTQCRHTVIFANGKCKQHGGETPPEYAQALKERAEEKLARQKLRLAKRIEKLSRKIQKWQQHRLNACSLMEPAKVSTEGELGADAGLFSE